MKPKAKVIGCLSVFGGWFVVAAPAIASALLCDQAARQAAADYGVPLAQMLAIGRVETGRLHEGRLQPWPWTIHQAGQGHWFASGQQALDFAQAGLELGDDWQDLGCFQINLHWHGGSFDSLADMIDPQRNADYAARLLVELHARYGSWADAVAAYHTGDPATGAQYAAKVATAMADLTADPPLNTGYPLLQAGATGATGSVVPRLGPGMPLLAGLR